MRCPPCCLLTELSPSAFWVNPYGVAFNLMTVSDLLLVDHDGNILEGTGKPGNGQTCKTVLVQLNSLTG